MLVRCLVPALALLLVVGVVSHTRSAEKAVPQLAHSVFFTLKDRSEAARDKFVASCQKYLTDHEGTVSFSLGTIAQDVEEPNVSVRDFDVALLVVFESKEAEAKYLVHPRHLKFVEENKADFAKVRVFDSYLAPSKH
ncbi:Dabb family protein [Singulisphaera sp. PoT]|uniref:Dabb family protein n=1 Tax=Singulisphaera sp. PoT TaxID=3411797 RepID=UPI003BF4CE9B